jgi:hypothetical protein
MYVKKFYKLLLSKKLPNSEIISMEFSTELGEEGADELELAKKVYESTRKDIAIAAKKDLAIKSLWKGMVEGLEHEIRISENAD